MHIPTRGQLLCALDDADLEDAHLILLLLESAGYKVALPTQQAAAIGKPELGIPSADMLAAVPQAALVVSTLPAEEAGATELRQAAIADKIPLFTCIDTVLAILKAVAEHPEMIAK
jgi:hypothetical protein